MAITETISGSRQTQARAVQGFYIATYFHDRPMSLDENLPRNIVATLNKALLDKLFHGEISAYSIGTQEAEVTT